MNVEFDGDNVGRRYTSRQILGAPVVPGMAKLVMNIGLAQDEKAAYRVLSIVAIIAVIAAIATYYFFVVQSAHAPVPESAIYNTQS